MQLRHRPATFPLADVVPRATVVGNADGHHVALRKRRGGDGGFLAALTLKRNAAELRGKILEIKDDVGVGLACEVTTGLATG